MTPDSLIEVLHEIKFFKGYTDDAIPLAEEKIQNNFNDGIAGEHKKYFQRYPGFALTMIKTDGEWDYEPYEPFVMEIANSSFGMFRPTEIEDLRDPDKGTFTLSFTVNDKRYSTKGQGSGWLPNEINSLIRKAFKEQCNKLEFWESWEVLVPGRGTDGIMSMICRKETYQKVMERGLIPQEPLEFSSVDWNTLSD